MTVFPYNVTDCLNRQEDTARTFFSKSRAKFVFWGLSVVQDHWEGSGKRLKEPQESVQ